MKRNVLGSQNGLARLRGARFAFAGVAALTAATGFAGAKSLRTEQSVAERSAGEPIMAIVSLGEQEITIYDAEGWILRAPVSSGQKGRETPAGIFSVLQKDAEHYSNIYDDAYMPDMQRLTWSGIALHGGVLPGHPASHGCIRMPYGFAERLFDATKLGMRVIVAPRRVAPLAIDHPTLLQPKGDADAAAAAAAAAEDEANGKAEQARRSAANAFREAAGARMAVRKLEILKLRTEAQSNAAERNDASATSPAGQSDDAKAKVAEKISEIEQQLAWAKGELQSKLDEMATAREQAAAAETARGAAADAVRKAARNLMPVAVFISRKTQRLYVRQAFRPVLDAPLTIQDAESPIGTHIFTAMERNSAHIRWSVVSLTGEHSNGSTDPPRDSARKNHVRDGEDIPVDASRAKAALDRITIPQEVADRVAEMLSPQSSLIISDEALSSETGGGTEFVVLMSGEPQGGLKHRSSDRASYRRPYSADRASYRRPYSDDRASYWRPYSNDRASYWRPYSGWGRF
jgi:hypothetical protein